MTMESYLEQGDTGCAVVRIKGTNNGSLLGQPATGKSVDIGAVDVVRVLGGRAVAHWGASDDLGMLTQLGPATPGITIPDAGTVGLAGEARGRRVAVTAGDARAS